jgi:large subunit ribosomal protein L30
MSDHKTSDMIRVTQIASSHGRKPGQQATLIGLGLNKIRKSRDLAATPETLGMVKKVAHLLKVETLDAKDSKHETK